MNQPKAHDGVAQAHARLLLQGLGMPGDPCPLGDHPALAWRRSGLMAITGRSDGPGLVCPAPLASAADGALAALRTLAPDAALPANGALLLGERARLLGLVRQGATSANGSCRILQTQDGHVALNLPRGDDWEMLPALFEKPCDSWSTASRHAQAWSANTLVERGRLLGLAIARDSRRAPPALPFVIARHGIPRAPSHRAPLVVDLSSLWAGPLAASLLGMAGANVVKVESVQRLDGARLGNAGFFDLLNGGKESATFDFGDASELRRLRDLIESADIVVEGSRPRALRQLGIRAEDVAARGATWVSITAHGRIGPAAEYVGFGDDAAIAGGLGAVMRGGWSESLFAGDAIADPLTGITAAVAGWSGWLSGGGCLISLALADVVAHASALAVGAGELAAWQVLAEQDPAPLYPLRRVPVAF